MFFFEDYAIDNHNFFSLIELVDQNFPVHFHRAAELIWVEKGTISVSIEQENWQLKKGECIFVFPNQMHEIIFIEQARLQILVFSPELIGSFFTKYKGYVPENPILRLEKPFPVSKIDSYYYQKSFLYDVCDKLVTNSPLIKVEYSAQTKAVQSLIAYVDEHYMEAITLKIAAANIKYDYFYLSKLFKKVTTYRFNDYLNQYRISQACYQLRGTQKSISEIAMDCGYQNMRTFNRNFQNIIACTPLQFRNKG